MVRYKLVMKNKETTVKSVRMKKSLVDTIDNLAREQNRNFSNMAETLLMKAIKLFEISSINYGEDGVGLSREQLDRLL